jgi:hypothetical protein
LSLLMQLILYQKLNTLFALFFEWSQLLWRNTNIIAPSNLTDKYRANIQVLPQFRQGIVFSYWSLSQVMGNGYKNWATHVLWGWCPFGLMMLTSRWTATWKRKCNIQQDLNLVTMC